jgi:hypothetical protein
LSREAFELFESAQSNLLHFTILSAQAEESPKLMIVTKPSLKRISVTVCYASFGVLSGLDAPFQMTPHLLLET